MEKYGFNKNRELSVVRRIMSTFINKNDENKFRKSFHDARNSPTTIILLKRERWKMEKRH